MKGYVYWDRHDFKHEVRYTLRYITKRWTYSERNEIEDGYKLSESYIYMEGGYRLCIYTERKKNGRIVYCNLRFFTRNNEDVFLRFEGNERDANAWLSWLYEEYKTEPDSYTNDYWQEQHDELISELSLCDCPEITNPKLV